MTWNYRVIQDENWFYLAEVYYDETGRPDYYSGAVALCGDTEGEIIEDYVKMGSAFDKPVLQAW